MSCDVSEAREGAMEGLVNEALLILQLFRHCLTYVIWQLAHIMDVPNSQFMFKILSLCYLVGCTSPEDMSSNSPQFVLRNGSNFLLDILSSLTVLQDLYFKKLS